jgi:predicted CopG family antitoxin
MKRTQIYIDDDVFSFLEKESKTANRSISEIIRESIREKHRHKSNLLMKRLDSIFGIWSSRNGDVNKYLKSIRRDRVV